MNKLYLKLSLIISFTLATLTSMSNCLSCTRILRVDDYGGVFTGRTMDWNDEMPVNLWVYPQGQIHDDLSIINPLKWKSKYGSIVANVYDLFPIDGMNEKGLGAHLLWLDASDYGKRDETLPGLSVLKWAQFYLDNFATVDEAVNYTEQNPFQIVPAIHPMSHEPILVHLAIEDMTGDSAIIEMIDGKTLIYHDRQYMILTNDPPFDQQLLNLKQYVGFGGDLPLPGYTESIDRFVRASYYLKYLPNSLDIRNIFGAVRSVMQIVNEPYGTSTPERPKVSWTLWRTIADLNDQVYYFNLTTEFNMFWAPLVEFNLQSGAPIMKLDLIQNHDLAGDVVGKFKAIN